MIVSAAALGRLAAPPPQGKEIVLEAKLAARMGRIGESATLAITRRVKELQAAGREVLDLGAGEPDFDSPGVAIDAAARALREGFTRYTENAGTLPGPRGDGVVMTWSSFRLVVSRLAAQPS